MTAHDSRPITADVAIVGAGAIGACIALQLARAGADVAVLDAGPGWGRGCSHGNAGLICASHAGPFATRADLVRSLAWLTRRDSPFGFSPRAALVPWGMRLLRATLDRDGVERVTELLFDLSQESAALHEGYAAEGLATGWVRGGLLYVCRTRGHFRAVARVAERSPLAALEPQVLSAREARAAEPLLGGELAGAVLYERDAHCDPVRFTTAVGEAALDAGARLLSDCRVDAIAAAPSRGGSRRVRLLAGKTTVDAGTVVLAAGAETPALAPGVPIVAGVGCSIDLAGDGPAPRRPFKLEEERVAVTPFEGRVRLAGTMLLGARADRAPERRVAAIRAAGARALPAWANATPSRGWAGARPCTPDGLPRIGWLPGAPGVLVAAGHAMLGLTLAPVTARLVQALIEGRADRRIAPLAPRG